jgi:hypothetical protein
MHQQHLVGAKGETRLALQRRLLADMNQLGSLLSPTVPAPDDAPLPRRVAVAMALAAFSQPHLAATFGTGRRDGTATFDDRPNYPHEAPLAMTAELLESALGLSRWELDDLREDIDRRASHSLKRDRTLNWLWTHFKLPKNSPSYLFRVLFPGMNQKNTAQLVRRASRLYAVVNTPEIPLTALYLSWMGADVEGQRPPLPSFHSRYVDQSLRNSIARGVGGAPREVDHLLDQMVVLVPRDAALQFLERDQWRTSGLSCLSNLGDDYLEGARLVGPIECDGLEWTRWLEIIDDNVVVDRNERALFDEFALDRVQALMGQVYAGLLARIEQTDADELAFETEDLDLMDVPRHLRAALQPMLDWARSEDTQAHIAARLRVPRTKVTAALEPLADAWESHINGRWVAPPTPSRPHTIASILVAHLVGTRCALLRLMHRPADPRWEHRNLTLLFAAHYLVDAPIERLWMKTLSDMPHHATQNLPPPEDVVGCWFWAGWMRLLDQLAQGSEQTNTP